MFAWIAKQPFLLRLAAFLVALAVGWAFLAIPIALIISAPHVRDLVFLGWLLIVFFCVLAGWTRWIYQQPSVLEAYGLTMNGHNARSLGLGWVIGCASLAALFGVEWLLGWLSWTPAQEIERWQLMWVMVEGALVAIAVGLGEELLFRGWLLNELERDYHPAMSLWVSSLMFAALHFIKPLEEIIRTFQQFPGLVLLGLILVWARRSQRGLLGLSIGLHGGLVWGYYIIQVGQLASIHPDAPEGWVGVNQNPLAGGLGFLSLLGMAVWIRYGRLRKVMRRP